MNAKIIKFPKIKNADKKRLTAQIFSFPKKATLRAKIVNDQDLFQIGQR